MKIGILASGDLGKNTVKKLVKSSDVAFVMTDKGSPELLAFCQKNEIDCFVGNPRAGRATEFIKGRSVDVLVSVNYLFLIEKELIDLPTKLAFNIHGSLLPKYRGRTPHVWAIINNETKTGITAHKIDEGCDTGDIIKQVAIKIEKDDTGAAILRKYKAAYPPLIEAVLHDIKKEKLVFEPQCEELATFFDKRTPEDGHINWNWQKERLHNWVRAQAHPYPGAFFYGEGKKFIIDKIGFSNYKFRGDMQNGLVLSTNPHRIKVPNGVVEIQKCRNDLKAITKNMVLK